VAAEEVTEAVRVTLTPVTTELADEVREVVVAVAPLVVEVDVDTDPPQPETARATRNIGSTVNRLQAKEEMNGILPELDGSPLSNDYIAPGEIVDGYRLRLEKSRT
jgi:hypothetical protein